MGDTHVSVMHCHTFMSLCSKGQQVSMAVHRMGNTLLIDNFRTDHMEVGMQGGKFRRLVHSGGLPQVEHPAWVNSLDTNIRCRL